MLLWIKSILLGVMFLVLPYGGQFLFNVSVDGAMQRTAFPGTSRVIALLLPSVTITFAGGNLPLSFCILGS